MSDAPFKPLGVAHAKVEADRVAPPTTRKAYALRDIAKRFEFFTPALLMTHGRFDRDPVREFAAAHPAPSVEQRPTIHDSEHQLFDDLGHAMLLDRLVDWNHRLYVIERSRWQDCHDFIGAIVLVDRSRGYYARVCSHKVSVVDHVAAARNPTAATLPTVPVTVFGLAGNDGTVYLSATERPAFRRMSPQPEIVREANAVLGIDIDHARLLKDIGKRIV